MQNTPCWARSRTSRGSRRHWRHGKNHLHLLLDSAHNEPGALLNPKHYNIEGDVEHLRELLDEMDDPKFIG